MNIIHTTIDNISPNNEIFNILKKDYNDFDIWLDKMITNKEEVYFTESNNKITSILMLKINEEDSNQFFEKGNILKIRTFLVLDSNKGIGTKYLNIIDNISKENNINYIYLTIKENKKELIEFMKKNNYKEYNKIKDEYVYYKKRV